MTLLRALSDTATVASSGSPSPNVGEGNCEQIENRLLPALSVRRGTAAPRACSAQVERALRARFHLWIRRRDGSGLAQFIFFTASKAEGRGGSASAGVAAKTQYRMGIAEPGQEHSSGARPLAPFPEAVKE